MLLGRLPLSARRWLGARLGDAARLLRARRFVAQRNLALAFPQMSTAQRDDILRQHFRLLGGVLLDECALLSMGQEKLRQFVRLQGEERLADSAPLILLLPHFIGASIGGVRLSLPLGGRLFFHYKPQHSRFWDAFYGRLRKRWGAVGVKANSSAMRLCARHLRQGGRFLYLPDIDPKVRKSTVFVPFLGVPQVATTSALARLAALTGARVALCRVGQTAAGYEVCVEAPLDNFPTADLEENTGRINQLIGAQVTAAPAQYYWLHRRFKTRPAGEKSLYG